MGGGIRTNECYLEECELVLIVKQYFDITVTKSLISLINFFFFQKIFRYEKRVNSYNYSSWSWYFNVLKWQRTEPSFYWWKKGCSRTILLAIVLGKNTFANLLWQREREREKCMCACDCLLRKRDISTFFKARSRSCRSRGAEICAATTISITHAHTHTLHNTNENLGSCSSHTTLHLLLLCTTRAYVGNNNKYLLTSIDNECVCMRQRMCGYLQNQLTFGLCSIVEGTMCKL